jgi:hypothetical protein
LNIQNHLIQKLAGGSIENQRSHREKAILSFFGIYPGYTSVDITKKLVIITPTMKRIVPDLLVKKLVEKHGIGLGTNYSTD